MRLHLVIGLLWLAVGCGAEDKADTASTVAPVTDTSDADDSGTTPVPEDTGGGPCDGLPAVTWSGWAQGFFRGYCTSCHSRTASDRWGAPEGIDFDTEADVVGRAAQIRSAVLDRQSMPVGGGVIEADLELLQIYLDCGL